MKKFIWFCFNVLRTLSFALVLFVLGAYLYVKVAADLEAAALNKEIEELAATEGGLGIYGGFSVLNSDGKIIESDRVPLSSGNQHLFFSAEEFLYSEHTRGRTEIYLAGEPRPVLLKKTLTRDEVEERLQAAGLRVKQGKSHVLNLDAVRMLESKQAYNKKSYKYFAWMLNGDTVTISQKQYPELQQLLAN